MSLIITADEAYQAYVDLNLRKKGSKSANFDVVQSILNKFSIQIKSRPSNQVRAINILL